MYLWQNEQSQKPFRVLFRNSGIQREGSITRPQPYTTAARKMRKVGFANTTRIGCRMKMGSDAITHYMIHLESIQSGRV